MNTAFTAGYVTIADARKAVHLDEDKLAGPYYKWQLPVSNPPGVDPTKPETLPPPPGTVVEGSLVPPGAGGAVPFPHLPAGHPLNAGPPNLLPPPKGPKGKPGAGGKPAADAAGKPPTGDKQLLPKVGSRLAQRWGVEI